MKGSAGLSPSKPAVHTGTGAARARDLLVAPELLESSEAQGALLICQHWGSNANCMPSLQGRGHSIWTCTPVAMVSQYHTRVGKAILAATRRRSLEPGPANAHGMRGFGGNAPVLYSMRAFCVDLHVCRVYCISVCAVCVQFASGRMWCLSFHVYPSSRVLHLYSCTVQ
jgi:hypothetical protein